MGIILLELEGLVLGLLLVLVLVRRMGGRREMWVVLGDMVLVVDLVVGHLAGLRDGEEDIGEASRMHLRLRPGGEAGEVVLGLEIDACLLQGETALRLRGAVDGEIEEVEELREARGARDESLGLEAGVGVRYLEDEDRDMTSLYL